MKKILSIFSVLLLAGSLWAADVTVTKTAAQVASEQGWATKSTQLTFNLDEVITFTTFGTNGYYSADNPNDWRIYQAREQGRFVISAKAGYVIKSINLTYGTKNATDVIARNSGKGIAEVNKIASGADFAVNATSVTLFTGNTSTSTNGQAKISSFTVVYSKLNGVEEAFTNVTQTGAAAADTKWQGDYAKWNVTGARRATGDTLAWNVQGTRTNNDQTPAFLQTTNAEGGVKHISFHWRQWGSENKATLKMNVQVGADFDKTQETTGIAAASAPFMFYDEEVACAKNEQIKITNISVKNTQSGRTVFRDLIITPYLLYTVKEADAYMKDGAFTNEALINNTTGAAVEYSLVGEGADQLADINTTTGAVTVKQSGQVTVKATWGQVSTTYTLNLHALSEPEMSFAKAEVRTVLAGSVANALSQKTDATPQYASSNTAVADVDASTGAITIKNVGQTKITATCAATESYKAGEASYELIVRAGGNTLKETFGKVDKAGNAGSSAGLNVIDWDGDLFTWQAKGNTRRKPNSDTIYNTTTQGTFIGMNHDSVGGTGILRSKEAVEGGIKYISFFWKQWANENDGRTLRLNFYAGEDSVTCVEHVAIKDNPKNVYWYYAASNLMKANKQLIIKNVSRLANGELAPSNARVILDTIEITPYLLYSLKEDTLDFLQKTTYKNDNLIDNRDNANAINYSILEGPATIETDGTVTATAAGTVKVQAEWDGVTTTYTLIVKGANQYTLTWDADGGVLTGGTPAGLVDEGAELEAPTATKVGYKHTGWDPAVPEVMPAEDFTSTAQYEAKKCNITLKSNYEGGEEDIKFVATYGEASPVGGETAKFTRPGYSIYRGFWKNQSTEASGERLVNSNGKFTTNVGGYTDNSQKWIRDAEEDITLYAHWKLDTFKITYANMEGATNFEDAPSEYTYETPTITLGTPTKTGYAFNGWKKTNAEGEAVTEIAKGSTGKITLWATWTANKTIVHFIANGGDATATFDTVVEYGTRVAILQAAEVTSKLTRENYKFNNYWTEEEGGLRMTNVVTSGKLYFLAGAREGYLDADGKWIKEGGEATFYAHWTLSTLVLNEGEDNSSMLSEANGKTVDVTMTRSALVANVWNSLCLPFAIAKTDLGEAQVVEMTDAEMEGDVIKVTFAEFNSDSLVAGTPYLVKPSAAVEFTAFEDKKIDATPKTIGNNGLIELTGIYSPFELTANDKTKLFLGQPDGQGNNLFFANKNSSLKGMRAYFNLLPQTSGAPVRLGRMVIATPTGMVDVNANVNDNQKMIIDGKLVIVRNGVYYDVNGQIIK